MTKPSLEQQTMSQVQGSTELISQPSITPFSSLNQLFTAINAATGAQYPIESVKMDIEMEIEHE